MKEVWAALSLLQKMGVVLLAWLALSSFTLGLWFILVGQHRDRFDDDEELREAVRRKLRDDEWRGRTP